MIDERINSILSFLGGLLAFVAVIFPMLVHIAKALITAIKTPNTRKIIILSLWWVACLSCFIFFVFEWFKPLLITSLIIILSSSAWFIGSREPVTRSDIHAFVYSTVFPIVFLIVILLGNIIKNSAEQSGPPNSHAFGTFVTDPADAGSAPKASGHR